MPASAATPTAHTAKAVEGDLIDQINELVKSIGALMRVNFVATVTGLGLTPPQALAVLELGEPIPMGALAEGLAFDASYITDIADQLESRGLLERRNDPSDRRRKILALTEKGESARSELEATLQGQQGLTTVGLSTDELITLRDLLAKVMEGLEANAAAAGRPTSRRGYLRPQ